MLFCFFFFKHTTCEPPAHRPPRRERVPPADGFGVEPFGTMSGINEGRGGDAPRLETKGLVNPKKKVLEMAERMQWGGGDTGARGGTSVGAYDAFAVGRGDVLL